MHKLNSQCTSLFARHTTRASSVPTVLRRYLPPFRCTRAVQSPLDCLACWPVTRCFVGAQHACLPQAGCVPFTSIFSPLQSFFFCAALMKFFPAAMHSGSTYQTPHPHSEPGGNFSRALVIGATNYDKEFRAHDISNGNLWWKKTLPFAGNATPATYSANGRQFVVIAAGGGKDLKSKSGGVYVACALPETAHP